MSTCGDVEHSTCQELPGTSPHLKYRQEKWPHALQSQHFCVGCGRERGSSPRAPSSSSARFSVRSTRPTPIYPRFPGPVPNYPEVCVDNRLKNYFRFLRELSQEQKFVMNQRGAKSWFPFYPNLDEIASASPGYSRNSFPSRNQAQSRNSLTTSKTMKTCVLFMSGFPKFQRVINNRRKAVDQELECFLL